MPQIMKFSFSVLATQHPLNWHLLLQCRAMLSFYYGLCWTLSDPINNNLLIIIQIIFHSVISRVTGTPRHLVRGLNLSPIQITFILGKISNGWYAFHIKIVDFCSDKCNFHQTSHNSEFRQGETQKSLGWNFITMVYRVPTRFEK